MRYAEQHGFHSLPDITDWSAAKAQNYIEQMERMVAQDLYTD